MKYDLIFFQVMTLILVGISLIFAAIFHIGSKEPSDDLVKSRFSNTVVDNVVRLRFYCNCEYVTYTLLYGGHLTYSTGGYFASCLVFFLLPKGRGKNTSKEQNHSAARIIC